MSHRMMLGVALAVVSWVLLTVSTMAVRDEMVAHGQQHAFIKQLMAERDQALRDRATLAQVVQYLEAQAKKAP